MDVVGDDGVAARVHIEKAASGAFPNPEAVAKLESEPPFPELAGDVWFAYQQLAIRREWNENGPVRFSWRELQAFFELTGIRLGRWHLRTLFAIEDAFFAARKEAKGK